MGVHNFDRIQFIFWDIIFYILPVIQILLTFIVHKKYNKSVSECVHAKWPRPKEFSLSLSVLSSLSPALAFQYGMFWDFSIERQGQRWLTLLFEVKLAYSSFPIHPDLSTYQNIPSKLTHRVLILRHILCPLKISQVAYVAQVAYVDTEVDDLPLITICPKPPLK